MPFPHRERELEVFFNLSRGKGRCLLVGDGGDRGGDKNSSRTVETRGDRDATRGGNKEFKKCSLTNVAG